MIQVQRLLVMRHYFLALGICRLQTRTRHHEPGNSALNPGQLLLQYHQLDTHDAITAALHLQL